MLSQTGAASDLPGGVDGGGTKNHVVYYSLLHLLATCYV